MTDTTSSSWAHRPGRTRFARVGRVLPVAVLQIVGTLLASRWSGSSGPTGAGGPPWLVHGPGAAVDPVVVTAPALVLLVAGVVVLPFRWRWPTVVLWATVVTTLGYAVLVSPRGPFVAALTMALANAWFRGRRLEVGVAAGLAVAVLPTADAVLGRSPGVDLATVLLAVAWVVVTIVLTELVRIRTERVADRRRQREDDDRRRAGAERVRIARELHDSVAHSMSLINLQSGVALHLGADLPDETRSTLEDIRDTSRQALVELRTILGVLRDVDGEPGSERNPTPGLDRLPALVERAIAAGVDVRVDVQGDTRTLEALVDRNAYRIVQESLTNVMKHAFGHRVDVHVAVGSDTVELVVRDAPTGTNARTAAGVGDTGNGIIGMRERATSVGGEFSAGPEPDGGWRVRAVLPVAMHAPSTHSAPGTAADGRNAP